MQNAFFTAYQILVGQLDGTEQVIGAVLVTVIAIAIWGIGWHRRQRAANKLGMSSLTFIISCFAIALIAASFGAYGLGARASKADVPTDPGTPKRMMTSYDVEARLRAIDVLDDAMSKLQPLAQIGQNDLLNHIDQYIIDGEAPDKLLQFGNQAKVVWDKINESVSDYQSRFPDIARTISLDQNMMYAVGLHSNSLNLREEILKWRGHDQMVQHIQGSRTLLEWRQSVGALSGYVSNTRNSLALKRREYETAEVYGK